MAPGKVMAGKEATRARLSGQGGSEPWVPTVACLSGHWSYGPVRASG